MKKFIKKIGCLIGFHNFVVDGFRETAINDVAQKGWFHNENFFWKCSKCNKRIELINKDCKKTFRKSTQLTH